MKLLTLLLSSLLSISIYAQDTSRVSLLFIGDVMGHDRQLEAAYNASTKTYDFDSCFTYISPIFKQHDYAIANLEVTLNCKPFKGYPSFSAPPELASALINSGVNVIVTANNHTADRGYKGVINTIKTLDSLKVKHTGVFDSQEKRNKNYPLVLEKNGIKLGLLNYTYGLNGNEIPKGTIINILDTAIIRADLEIAKTQGYDKIIVFVHWGLEYQLAPNKEQVDMANFIFNNGADIIIGSHPHVIQKSIMEKKNAIHSKETFITYSLGNFISNQRTMPRAGGQMTHIELLKINGKTTIDTCGYILTWVYAPFIDGKKDFYVLPVSKYENNPSFFLQTGAFNLMQTCITQMREVLEKDNIGVTEIR